MVGGARLVAIGPAADQTVLAVLSRNGRVVAVREDAELAVRALTERAVGLEIALGVGRARNGVAGAVSAASLVRGARHVAVWRHTDLAGGANIDLGRQVRIGRAVGRTAVEVGRAGQVVGGGHRLLGGRSAGDGNAGHEAHQEQILQTEIGLVYSIGTHAYPHKKKRCTCSIDRARSTGSESNQSRLKTANYSQTVK